MFCISHRVLGPVALEDTNELWTWFKAPNPAKTICSTCSIWCVMLDVMYVMFKYVCIVRTLHMYEGI